ncbi:hypothetical protein HYW74_04295 [Candidatus Pacearchaeota archaeon]|nr:hypothetical protein [Candidatus Pacearchaeota archaeon]
MKRNILVGLVFSIFILAIIITTQASLVSAVFWACFSDGQRIDYCNPNIPDRTANSDNYKLCMDSFDSARNCYTPGNWNVCNTLPPACTGGSGGGASIDITPPVMTLGNPLNNSLYRERTVLLAFNLNEVSDVYYLDLINGRGRWTKVCSNCKSYSNKRSFKEGINSLRIRARDRAGNEAFKNVIFFIDSKNPIIHKIDPKKGWASGDFLLQYTEDNLKKINLTYGNSGKGFKSSNLQNCASGKKEWCDINNVNLSSYNGQEIQYYFSVEDKAGNKVMSRIVTLSVDTILPKINSINTTIHKNHMIFKINITEINLDIVEYMDNSDSRPKWKRLCTKLNNGICEKQVSFRAGAHSVIIQASDEAGNIASSSAINFNIV